MISIHKGKVIGNGERPCNQCKEIKPFTEFYVRSTYGTPQKPAVTKGHFVTECVKCMNERSKSQERLPVWRTNVKSEQIVIDALMAHGIGATTGKVANAPDVDVVAWGWVNIECKYSPLRNIRGESRQFKFNTSPKQQVRGLLGHIVMLICEYPDGLLTYHMFGNKEPCFYRKDGRLKSAFTFTPDQYRLGHTGRKGHYPLTQGIMDSKRDRWHLIETWRLTLSKRFAEGQRPEYGKLFAA